MKPEGNAVVYCEGAFGSTYGKTAHGLVRFTERYNVKAVIDSTLSGQDAGDLIGKAKDGIPIVSSIEEAQKRAEQSDSRLTHFVIGIATDGGFLTAEIKNAVKEALTFGLNIDSGLHDFLSDDKGLAALASSKKLKIRDIRRPSESGNHMFTGRIKDVKSLKIASSEQILQ